MNKEYESLRRILDEAYDQAATGKGNARHSRGQSFEEQPMQVISDLLGTHSGLLFQAIKKIQESERLPQQESEAELLGAINYIVGAILNKRRSQERNTPVFRGYDPAIGTPEHQAEQAAEFFNPGLTK